MRGGREGEGGIDGEEGIDGEGGRVYRYSLLLLLPVSIWSSKSDNL